MATPTQYGAFIPTNFNFDAQQLAQISNIDPMLKELLVKLYQNVNQIALVLNIADKGIYPLSEFVNGQIWFPNPSNTSSTTITAVNRQVFRTVINFGALPNIGTKSVPHNINPNSAFTFTRIYGCSTQPNTSYIPLPYSSAADVAHNIELNADATDVNVITGADYHLYTITYIILEYIKF